jgi:phosphotransferase system enzyme I (PtsP)
VTLAAQLAVLIAHAQTQGLWLLSNKHQAISGIAASSGVAMGQFWCDNSQPQLEDVSPASGLNPDKEYEWLMVAVDRALGDFRRMRNKLDGDLNKDALAIFDLFTHLLNDPMLRKDLKSQIAKGDRADWALRQVVETYAERFSSMSDPYLRERAQDIRELGQRVLYFLYNSENEMRPLERPIILAVQELTASILASIPKDKLLAVVAIDGAANSHAAILSRALGIPTVMGAAVNLSTISDRFGIVDGYAGLVYLDPDKRLLKEYQALATEESELSEMVNLEIDKPAVTKDGEAIEVLLNAGLSVDSSIAINQNVDGVGLYRTEISFLLSHGFPSEEEQAQLYRGVLQAYSNKRVVMRTLDIGGDKPLPYLPIVEDNPFLGWRGIRFTLGHPDIFLIQLRAMMRASVDSSNLSILLPMVSSAQELDDALHLINQAYDEVLVIKPNLVKPKIGIMVEVPSMIYLLPLICDKIDFVSVGTNDLTQYLLAVDRNNARVADMYETMHPSVLLALKHIYDTCQQHDIEVCVCGELAGDPLGALLLIGIGYRAISMNTSNVAKVKYMIRHTELSVLQQLANKALVQPYGHQIYTLMRDYLEQNGFAGFIRAGKK